MSVLVIYYSVMDGLRKFINSRIGIKNYVYLRIGPLSPIVSILKRIARYGRNLHLAHKAGKYGSNNTTKRHSHLALPSLFAGCVICYGVQLSKFV